MNYILRAWLSVTRKKIKSLLLLFIVFVLCNVIAGMVSIGQSATNVTKIIKKDLGAKASIQVDGEAISGLTSEAKSAIPNLDESFINAIGSLTQIQYYDYNYVRFFQTELYQMNTNCQTFCNSDNFFLYGSHLASIYDILQHKIKLIYEPFGGSGSTLIAADQLDRICYCMELDPRYVDVIIERWENLTGTKSVQLNDT